MEVARELAAFATFCAHELKNKVRVPLLEGGEAGSRG